ncbi:hypothetical protein EW146_g4273 [Bondarzewia mesenterica]|uniref:Transcription initiation factor TFIID subunit 13 n=1 Tax=Bondarzewia mesenterica TaxID=1095465 RepID=A0A4S4LVK9_9AGAM|nr:hypothetical protein EW146_g4273 [Bondarzewia mesenterica]
MPRRGTQTNSSPNLKQQTLFDFLGNSSSSRRVRDDRPSKSFKLSSTSATQSSPAQKRKRHAMVEDLEGEEGNTSSDVDAIHFCPRSPTSISSLDEEQPSPRRPSRSKRPKTSFSESDSIPHSEVESSVLVGDDEENIGIPARWKGKGIMRRRQIKDSDDESDEQPRRRKLTKGMRPPSPADSQDILDEVDEAAIVDSRLRARDKKSAFEQNLEKLKRKKRGLAVKETSDEDEDDEDISEPATFPGAKPTTEFDSDAPQENEDNDDSASSDDDDFIIEDEDQIAAPDLPFAFSMNTHQDLAHHFKIVCQLFVHLAVQPEVQRKSFMNKMLNDNEYFSIPLQIARRKLSGLRDSLVASSVWKPDFRKSLETYPEFSLTRLDFSVPHCDACHLGRRLSTLVGRLGGVAYDRVSFQPVEEESDTEDSDSDLDESEDKADEKETYKEFQLGRFCAARTQTFHRFSHWEFHLFRALLREIDGLQSTHGKRGFIRVAHANGIRPPDDLSDANGIMEWLDQRGVSTQLCTSVYLCHIINLYLSLILKAMSYYPSQPGQQPATPGAYPYSAYHPGTPGIYPQTAGAYSYPTASPYPATAVTGYGTTWPYSYSYYQQHLHAAPRPSPAAPSTATASQAILQVPAATQKSTFSAYQPAYSRESLSAASLGGATARGYRKQSSVRGLFTKELRNLMFGFGDDRNPANDTVNVMEEILVEYIADVCQTALSGTKKARLSIEDLRRALSRPADAKKLARMEELLFMQEDIKRARAQFDDSEINQSSALQS